MKNIYLFLFLFFLFPSKSIFSQEVSIPEVKIKDHNGTYGTIDIDCNYNFYNNKPNNIQLTADYSDIRNSNNYTVSNIEYNPVVDFSAGTLIHIKNTEGKSDDTFGSIINLPFNFCFYGKQYSNIIVSDNGVVSFDTSMANKDCPWLIAGQIPNSGLPKASILGPYHDMSIPVDVDMVKVYTEGIAPYRKFIINFNNISQFSSDKKSTSQIVLYETTNVIDIYIKEKSLNTTSNKERRALIGLTNASGSGGIAAPGRNTGEWEAHNEAWRFLPSGSSNISIRWYDQYNKLLGSSASLIVNPSINTKYKVVVTYNLCSSVVRESEINVNFSPDFPTANNVIMDINKAPCVNNGESAEIDLTGFQSAISTRNDVTFSYYTTKSGAEDGNSQYLISDPEHYKYQNDNTEVYVRVLKEKSCYATSSIKLRLNKKPKIENNRSFNFCNTSNNTSLEINLLTQVAYQLQGFSSSTMSIKFYPTEKDALSNINEITNYTKYTASSSTTIYFRVWNKDFNNLNCFDIFSFNLNVSGNLQLVESLDVLVCYLFKDQKIEIDLTQFEEQLYSNANYDKDNVIKYYTSSSYSSGSEIKDPKNAKLKLNTTVYIQITDAVSGCKASTKINLLADGDCDGNGGGGMDGTGEGASIMCNIPEGTYTTNLATNYLQYYLPVGLTLNDIEILDFRDEDDNIVQNPYEVIFTPPSFNEKITARFRIKKSGIIAFRTFPVIYTNRLELEPDHFLICNYDNETTKSVSVSLDETFEELYGTPNFKLTYFNSIEDLRTYVADRENNQHLPITNVVVSKDSYKKVCVLMEYESCIFEYEVYLGLTYMETVELNYTICDFGGDSYEKINLTAYENDVKKLFNPTDEDVFEIEYLTPNPEGYEMTSSPSTVYLSVKKNKECSVKIALNFTFTTAVSLPTIEELVTICDEDKNNEESIDLNTIISNINPNSEISFYTNQYDAEVGSTSSQHYIGTYDGSNPILRLVYNRDILYIRVKDKTTSCFKIIPVTISLNQIDEPSNKTIIACDNDVLGEELILVSEIKKQLIANNSTLNESNITLQLYPSKQDATAGINEITTSYLVTSSSNIYLKVTNSTKNCSGIFELSFDLTAPPVLNSEVEYSICNNNTKNNNETINETINLNGYNKDFITLGTEADYTFEYYYDELLNNKVNSNTVTITEFPLTLWIKVSNKSGCYSKISFTIKELPSFDDQINDGQINFCSDSEKQTIYLTDYAESMILNPGTKDDYIITYHYTKQEAINNSSSTITDNLIKNGITVSDKDVFYIKFTNKKGCYIIKKLDVVINPTPKAGTIFPYICDETDGKLDGKYIIEDLDDFKQFRSQIITGESESFLDKSYTFTYYKTLVDAENKQNNVNSKNFTLTDSDLITPGTPGDPYFYQLWVRIDNKETGCFSIVSIMFNINPKVTLKEEIAELTECDILGNGSGTFNLTSAETILSNIPNPKFNYFLSEAEARNNTSTPLSNTSTYNSRVTGDKEGFFNIDYIYVRVKDLNGAFCENIAKIKLRTYPYIKITNIPDITVCEFQSDGKTENTINLWEETKLMLTGVDTEIQNDLNITFHTNESNALSDIAISSSELTAYQIPVGVTKIWVKFSSKTTHCYQTQEISIKKLEAPKINQVNHIICDDNLDDIYDLTLSYIDNSIINNHQNYEISYYENSTNAELGTNPINKNGLYSIPYSHFPKTLAIRVIDSKTSCVTTGTITINTNPKINLINKEVELIACDEDNDGYTSFDLTLVSDDISQDSDISFSYFRSLEDAQKNQNPILNYSSYINKNANESFVYVRIEEYPISNTRCPSLAKIKLKTYYSANPLPAENFICPRGLTILDGGNFDQWEWRFNGKVLSNERYLEVSEIGTYSLTVTKILNYGIACPSTFTIEIKLLEEPVIIDLKQGTDYISVIAKGPAPLEYSIDQINWQIDNTFYKLTEGIYTFYVRSKANGCNSITSKGIIFGIPNVITPNGDNHNDVWKLGGLDLFNGEYSHIKIFNRYGKTVFEQSSNTYFLWDGKYLGRVLPTSSYWYIISIADGRQFTGWILLRNYDDLDTYK